MPRAWRTRARRAVMKRSRKPDTAAPPSDQCRKSRRCEMVCAAVYCRRVCGWRKKERKRNKEVSWRLPLYVLEKPEVSASSQIIRLWCAVSSGGFRHYAKTSQSYRTIWSRFLSQGRRISAWWIFIWAEGWAKSLLLLVAARQWHNCIWRYFHLDSRLHAVCCQPPGAKLVSLSLCISVNRLSLCSERETHHWCGTINDHSSRPKQLLISPLFQNLVCCLGSYCLRKGAAY